MIKSKVPGGIRTHKWLVILSQRHGKVESWSNVKYLRYLNSDLLALYNWNLEIQGFIMAFKAYKAISNSPKMQINELHSFKIHTKLTNMHY